VARVLEDSGLGTLLVDLLTLDEERVDSRTGTLRFDIAFLARRVLQVVDWSTHAAGSSHLPLGLFGSSTGAAAALVAAAERPAQVSAVVSRGGRPDLAERSLAGVRAPTLLIVGGDDVQVLALNRWAFARLGSAERRIVVVPGATHLFDEPGALDEVARLAAGWFGRQLRAPETVAPDGLGGRP
jgi:pimeloyl-ACP methyl ester carboxylesterase